ncbi:hypothetical protein BJ742DRAFT_800389 [Cladochytrium replicatum]|nr:hypothetical protein BJ742DRAFT_800389 [Cladochytrium replicatum]
MPSSAAGSRSTSARFYASPSQKKINLLIEDVAPHGLKPEPEDWLISAERDRIRKLYEQKQRNLSGAGEKSDTNAPQFRATFRARKTADGSDQPGPNDSATVTSLLPIQPWESVKEQISTLLNSKGLAPAFVEKPKDKNVRRVSMMGADTGSGLGNEHHGGVPSSTAMSLTIPHGFQLVRSMPHSRPTVRSVLHTPSPTNADFFVSVDAHNVYVYRGADRIKKIPTIGIHSEHQDDLPLALGGGGRAGVFGISKWIYIEPLKIFVVVSNQLQLRVLDSHLLEMSNVPTSKPVLSINWLERNGNYEIVTGEIGSMRLWRIHASEGLQNRDLNLYSLQETLRIKHFSNEDWVGSVQYEPSTDQLIATVESSVYILDYTTGDCLSKLLNIHSMSITAIAVYEPMDYLITGAKDGKVKVWNSQHCLVYEFYEHLSAVTSLLLVENLCEAAPRSVPVVMSCSLDSTIRMWNFETGQCTYRLDTNGECLGMSMIRKDLFFHFSKDCIYVWKLNRNQLTMTFLRSQPFILKRYAYSHFNNQEKSEMFLRSLGINPVRSLFDRAPSRILSVATDGSIRFVSPVSGAVILTGYPSQNDSPIMNVVFNTEEGCAYMLNSAGEIVVYNTTCNPASIIAVRNPTVNPDTITCFTGIDILLHLDYHAAVHQPVRNTKLEETIDIPKQDQLNYIQKQEQQFNSTISRLGIDSSAASFVFETRPESKKERVFHLLAGTSGGQIVYIDISSHEKQYIIAQAHSSEVATIKFDHVNLLLLSVSRDLTVHVWKLHFKPVSQNPVANPVTVNTLKSSNLKNCTCKFADSEQTKQPGGAVSFQQGCPVALELHNTITFSGWMEHLSGHSQVPLEFIVSINPVTQQIGVPINGTLVLKPYHTDNIVNVLTLEEESSGLVTCVSNLPELHLWVTSSTDGWVKIWDESATLIRELQFGESIASVEFANCRGDLLLGLSDQIGLLRIQDYLPHYILKAISSKTFTDDEAEIPLMFDSNLDFWQYYYNQSKSIDGFWHVHRVRDEFLKEIDIPAHLHSISLKPRNAQDKSTHKRRHKRLFLQQEVSAYKHSRKQTEIYQSAESDENENEPDEEAFISKKGQVYNIVTSVYEDFIALQPVELIRANSPTEFSVPASEEVIDVEMISSQDARPGPIIQEVAKKHHSQVTKELEKNTSKRPKSSRKKTGPYIELLRRPTVPQQSVTTESIAKRRDRVRRQLKAAGVMLPNSSVLVEVAPPPEKQRQRTKIVTSRGGSAGSAKDNNDAVRISQSQPSRQFRPTQLPLNRENLQRYRGKATPKASNTISDPVNISIPSALLDQIEMDPKFLDTDDQNITVAVAVSSENIDSLDIKDDLDDFLELSLPDAKEISATEVVEPKHQKIRTRKPSLPKATKQFKPKIPHRVTTEHAKLIQMPSQTVSKPANVFSISPYQVPSVLKTAPLKPQQALPQQHNSQLKTKSLESSQNIIFHPTQIVEVTHGRNDNWRDNDDESVDTTDEDLSLDALMTDVDQEINAAFEDKILSKNIPEGISLILNCFWFPGLKGKPMNLTNIICVLFDVMRSGLWSEKCEAAKALLFLFSAYKTDFRDPVNLILIPQLEWISDDNWQVRAQLCSNMAGYNVRDSQILSALIGSLRDENSTVRLMALGSLRHFGINCRESLRQTMIEVGLVKNIGSKNLPSRLLDLLLEHHQREVNEQRMESIEAVRSWLSNMSSDLFWGLRRTSSFEQHLAGDFFPHDLPGFTMPMPSLAVLASHPYGAVAAYNQYRDHTDDAEFVSGVGMNDTRSRYSSGMIAAWDEPGRADFAVVRGGSGNKQHVKSAYNPGGGSPGSHVRSDVQKRKETWRNTNQGRQVGLDKDAAIAWMHYEFGTRPRSAPQQQLLKSNLSLPKRDQISAQRRPLTAGTLHTLNKAVKSHLLSEPGRQHLRRRKKQ